MPSPLCKYNNALGIPGKGVHSYRFAGVAIVDVVLTVLAAALIKWILDWWRGEPMNFWYVLGGLFVAGIVAHRLFCVRATVDQLLFR